MWQSLLTLPLLIISVVAQSQNAILDFTKLPTCAQQCGQLINAQAACISVPSTEKSCFCESAYLTVQTNLFTSPDGTCITECPSATDRQQIQNWFVGYCKGGSGTTNTPASTTTASASQSTKTSSSSSSSQNGDASEPQSWWSGHAKWIAMVIVLIVAFVIIIFFGVWWKRRHDRKVNQGSTVPLPVGWGPNSNPHSYPGPNAEKRTAAQASRAANNNDSMAEKGKSRTLKKLVGRG